MTRVPHRAAILAATTAALVAGGLTAGPAMAAGTEHISNGTFTSGTDPWWATPNVTMSAVSGRLCAQVPAGATNVWDAGVGYNGLPLVKGDVYTVTFDASASVAVTVKANVQLSEDPYTATMSRDTALTSRATTFTYTFSSSLDSPAGQLTFQVGGAAAQYTFCVDDVSLRGGNA